MKKLTFLLLIFTIKKSTCFNEIYNTQLNTLTPQHLTVDNLNPLYCSHTEDCQKVAGNETTCYRGECICDFGYEASPSEDSPEKGKNSCTFVFCKKNADCRARFANTECVTYEGKRFCYCTFEFDETHKKGFPIGSPNVGLIDVDSQSCQYNTFCEGNSHFSCLGRFGENAECCGGECLCKVGFRLSSGRGQLGGGFSDRCFRMSCNDDVECQAIWPFSQCTLGKCDCDETCQRLTNRKCVQYKVESSRDNKKDKDAKEDDSYTAGQWALIIIIIIILLILVCCCGVGVEIG